MSDFDWLEDIVKARTPGKWEPKQMYHEEPARIAGTGPQHLYCGENARKSFDDAVFIATLGTLADKIMDVVKAAEEAVYYDSGAPALKDIVKALAALQAAKEEI